MLEKSAAFFTFPHNAQIELQILRQAALDSKAPDDPGTTTKAPHHMTCKAWMHQNRQVNWDLAVVVGAAVDEVAVRGVLAEGHEVHGALAKLDAPARPRHAPLRHCPQLHHPLRTHTFIIRPSHPCRALQVQDTLPQQPHPLSRQSITLQCILQVLTEAKRLAKTHGPRQTSSGRQSVMHERRATHKHEDLHFRDNAAGVVVPGARARPRRPHSRPGCRPRCRCSTGSRRTRCRSPGTR